MSFVHSERYSDNHSIGMHVGFCAMPWCWYNRCKSGDFLVSEGDSMKTMILKYSGMSPAIGTLNGITTICVEGEFEP